MESFFLVRVRAAQLSVPRGSRCLSCLSCLWPGECRLWRGYGLRARRTGSGQAGWPRPWLLAWLFPAAAGREVPFKAMGEPDAWGSKLANLRPAEKYKHTLDRYGSGPFHCPERKSFHFTNGFAFCITKRACCKI